jgi:hypothetical protein
MNQVAYYWKDGESRWQKLSDFMNLMVHLFYPICKLLIVEALDGQIMVEICF